MRRKYFKNLITLLIITSFVLTPFFGIYSQAQAQPETSGGYETGADYGGGLNGGISGYLTGLAPAITQLPLCKGKLGGVISGLFKKGKKELTKQLQLEQMENNKLNIIKKSSKLKEKESAASSGIESVEVNSKEINKKLDAQDAKLNELKETSKSLEENEVCLKSIGQLVTKMMLQKITLSTVEWINSGFDGKPAFIQDPGEFFGDIAKNEILQFGLEIDDPTLYPFGKAFMRSQVQAFNTKFAQNAQYSLNELIQNTTPQYSSETFQKDFSQGGWSAWTYMTSVPANNPIGFQLMASNELQKRLEGTSMSRANEIRGALTQAAGYLGDERCVEPKGLLKMTREEDLVARGINKSYEDTITLPPLPAPVVGTDPVTGKPIFGVASTTPRVIKNTTLKQPVCLKWEYVTPGQMVATAATNVMGFSNDALLKADDLNAAMAAILDALLTRLPNEIMNKGFANFSTEEGRDGSFVMNAGNMLSEGGYSQVEDDFSLSQRNSEWLRNNPNFNIRTDLTQAMIDEQRIYVEKMENYNEALEVLIKNIYQLDYCIPGPNPLWREKAYERLDELSKEIPNTAGGTIDLVKGIFLILKGLTLAVDLKPLGIGVGATFNVGYIAEGVYTILANGIPEDALTRYYYTTILRYNTGLKVAPSNQIGSKGDVINIIEGIIDAYDKALQKTFTKNTMPKVTNLAKNEYLKIEGYKQMIEDNEEEIFYRKSAITKLAKIKNTVDALIRRSGGQLDEDYKMDATTMAEFARISNDLVDGDDIANIDGLYKQAKDDSNYVYNDLLTGESGCEKDKNARLGTGLKATESERRLYPEEIFTPLLGRGYNLAQTQSQECGVDEILNELPGCTIKQSVPECKDSEILDSTGKCVNFNPPSVPDPINENYDIELDKLVDETINYDSPPVDITTNTQGTENTSQKGTKTQEGILFYGHYVSNNRKEPLSENRKIEQDVKIPKGILDVDKKCPLLVIGPSINQAIKRSLKSQIKTCQKELNGNEEVMCVNKAIIDNKKLKTESGLVENELNKMCDFKDKSWDSIRFFEKRMNIY